MNAGERHPDDVQQPHDDSLARLNWEEDREVAGRSFRGFGLILLVIVLVAASVVVTAVVAFAQSTPPVAEVLDVDPGTATALADSGVDPALTFLVVVLLTLVGLIAWGLHRKAAR